MVSGTTVDPWLALDRECLSGQVRAARESGSAKVSNVLPANSCIEEVGNVPFNNWESEL